jgi:N-acetylglutamate synthase-like GNAT family acetyltransferase
LIQNAFSIRAARRRDIPEMTRLNAQLGYPGDTDIVLRRYRRIVQARRNHRIFVAVAGGSSERSGQEVIGWIHVFISRLLTVGPRAEIGGLVVDEHWRSRGAGATLVRRAERWAKLSGVTEIIVRSNVVRTRAHEFYEKCGYNLLKQSRVYRKVIQDSSD